MIDFQHVSRVLTLLAAHEIICLLIELREKKMFNLVSDRIVGDERHVVVDHPCDTFVFVFEEDGTLTSVSVSNVVHKPHSPAIAMMRCAILEQTGVQV